MKRIPWVYAVVTASAVCTWLLAEALCYVQAQIDRAYLDGFQRGGDLVIEEVQKWSTNLFSGSEGIR